MTSVSTGSKQEENSAWHHSNCHFVNWWHGVWSIKTCFTISHTVAVNHTTCVSLLIFFYISNDKWWPQCQLGGSMRKTVCGITATAFLWIECMEYDQYRPVLQSDTLLVTIHLLLDSIFILKISIDKWPCQWQLGTSKRKQGGGHTSNCLFVDWAHGVWSI
jgi:hypothetical protein